MVLGFGKKAKSAPLRDNNPKNKNTVTIKKAKYPLFKGYNPPGGPGRGTFHKKTEREKRLNKAWEILNPPGYGEGPEYKGKIRARVDELNAIPSKSEIDRIELAYLKDLQKDNFMDKEDFKWAKNYIGEAKNGWNAAAEAEWNRTFPDVSDPLPPPPSTPPPTAVTTAAPTAAVTAAPPAPAPPTSNPSAAPTAVTAVTAAPTAVTSILPPLSKNYINRKAALSQGSTPTAATTAATTAAPTAAPVTSILPPLSKNYINRKAALSQGSTPTTPSDPTPPVLTQSTVSNAGDPTNINSTIKRMKCIVCNSQFIIYDGLGKKGEAPKCSKCNSSTNKISKLKSIGSLNSAAKNNGLGNNFLKSINTNLLGKNTESAFNTPGSLNLEAMANARAAAKKTTGGKRSTRKQRKNKKRASRRR